MENSVQTILAGVLEKSELFTDLGAEQRERLIECLEPAHYGEGEKIIHQVCIVYVLRDCWDVFTKTSIRTCVSVCCVSSL